MFARSCLVVCCIATIALALPGAAAGCVIEEPCIIWTSDDLVDVETEDDAQGGILAISVMGDASSDFAVSAFGNASGNYVVSGFGDSAGWAALSLAGDAQGGGLAVAPAGDASERTPGSGNVCLGYQAGCGAVAASGTGDAQGIVAVSLLGHADGRFASASLSDVLP